LRRSWPGCLRGAVSTTPSSDPARRFSEPFLRPKNSVSRKWRLWFGETRFECGSIESEDQASGAGGTIHRRLFRIGSLTASCISIATARAHSILQFNVFSLCHRNDRPNVEWDESCEAKPRQQAIHWQCHQ